MARGTKKKSKAAVIEHQEQPADERKLQTIACVHNLAKDQVCLAQTRSGINVNKSLEKIGNYRVIEVGESSRSLASERSGRNLEEQETLGKGVWQGFDPKQLMVDRKLSFIEPSVIHDHWLVEKDITMEDIKSVPVWIQLPKLKLRYWNAISLSRMMSVVGIPLEMDEMTSKKMRTAFARVLVEVKIADKEWKEKTNGSQSVQGMKANTGKIQERIEKEIPEEVEKNVTLSKGKIHRETSPSGKSGSSESEIENKKDDVMIQNQKGIKVFVHCWVKNLTTQCWFYVTVVYADYQAQGRIKLWEELKQIADHITGAWLIMGDFNIVINHEERLGGRNEVSTDTDKFKAWMEDGEVWDMPTYGGKYTWWNRQIGDQSIMAKLDRTFGNGD
ncbi:OLC1v1012868C1 [Oldenlandia corymbosa var. corymbosa]|uniref:OLC1v1012868C1 n=1 Tax=Oldenlandia corymbosa var. corymbosa TaxID=529605 RepID=A0AAV1E000_OLDCO|nr:OLC1v1012868C1 [Oldenlandia corymbosa var. corymbosa]